MEKQEKNRKAVLWSIIGVIAVILVTIGLTYAYWLVTKTQEGRNFVTTGCLDIDLVGKNDITLTNQYPMSNEDGMKLTPYTFTVTNKCEKTIEYRILLNSMGTESESMTANAIKVALNDDLLKVLDTTDEITSMNSDEYESHLLGYSTLFDKASETFELRLWIDENASTEEMNKTFRSKIVVETGQGIEHPVPKGTLDEYILYHDFGLELGDIVAYNSGVADYTGTWKVLGITNNQLDLVSDVIGDLTLNGINGYNTGVEQLDTLAAPYLNENYANNARSIRVEDIIEIIRYNPAKTTASRYNADGTLTDGGKETVKFLEGQYNEYGVTGTYQMVNGYITYKGSNGLTSDGTNIDYTVYTKLDGTVLTGNETETATSDYYRVMTSSADYITASDRRLYINGSYDHVYSEIPRKVDKMLRIDNVGYWLASQSILANEEGIGYGLRYYLDEGYNSGRYGGRVDKDRLYRTTKGEKSSTRSVRAVIRLNPELKITDTNNDNIYEISN